MAVEAAEENTGLPKWLDDLLKPGVSNAVFVTLKSCLVGLVLVLAFMLSVLQDPVRCSLTSAHPLRGMLPMPGLSP